MEERTTKESLERRAIGVITSSGALATLLFALAALITKPAAYELPNLSRLGLVLVLIAFVGAALFAIFAARPGTYQEVTIASLRDAATHMSAPVEQGEPAIAKVLIDITATARNQNASKAKHLKRAVTAQAAAAVLLACVVAVILLTG